MKPTFILVSILFFGLTSCFKKYACVCSDTAGNDTTVLDNIKVSSLNPASKFATKKMCESLDYVGEIADSVDIVNCRFEPK
ncbi:MAG TPA: hypothetical protein PLP27_03415 [Crocinitomicaceae bacterium]|nr:hypothetical protein [Crocinitomicaceae bacterium]